MYVSSGPVPVNMKYLTPVMCRMISRCCVLVGQMKNAILEIRGESPDPTFEPASDPHTKYTTVYSSYREISPR